jgi:hypothetical protein
MHQNGSIRYAVQPRHLPAQKIARRLGLTLLRFDEVKAELFARGFPRPDPTTGNYDLAAVDTWMDRQSGLASESALTAEPKPRNALEVFVERRASHGSR